MGRPAMWQLDQTSSCFQLNELNSISERDNARVNRADEKCKLVKTESDTMEAKRTSDDKPNATPENASVQRFVIQRLTLQFVLDRSRVAGAFALLLVTGTSANPDSACRRGHAIHLSDSRHRMSIRPPAFNKTASVVL